MYYLVTSDGHLDGLYRSKIQAVKCLNTVLDYPVIWIDPPEIIQFTSILELPERLADTHIISQVETRLEFSKFGKSK